MIVRMDEIVNHKANKIALDEILIRLPEFETKIVTAKNEKANVE